MLVQKICSRRWRHVRTHWEPSAVIKNIQAVLPNRVFAFRDLGFHALAAFMAILACVVFGWAGVWRSQDQRVF